MKNKEQLKKQSKATASFKQYKKDVYLQTIREYPKVCVNLQTDVR